MPAAYTSELAQELAPDVLDRFLRYVRVDTQSARDREGSPSTPGQLDLSRMLVEELHEIGLEDAALDEHGYVLATLPATNGAPHAVGLIAHVDVSPDAPGAGVEPIVHRDYDGSRVELPARRHGARPRRHAGARGQVRPRRRHLQRRHAARAPTTRPAWRRSWPRSPTSPPTRSSPARR